MAAVMHWDILGWNNRTAGKPDQHSSNRFGDRLTESHVRCGSLFQKQRRARRINRFSHPKYTSTTLHPTTQNTQNHTEYVHSRGFNHSRASNSPVRPASDRITHCMAPSSAAGQVTGAGHGVVNPVTRPTCKRRAEGGFRSSSALID